MKGYRVTAASDAEAAARLVEALEAALERGRGRVAVYRADVDAPPRGAATRRQSALEQLRGRAALWQPPPLAG